MGGLSIKGYVLEPPRVGSSNSAFTLTPNVYVSDQGAFDTAYPAAETEPRTEYHVFVLVDGDHPDATFAWTKNEVINRFDYAGREQRFKTLPGAPLAAVGELATDSNTERLSVTPPTSTVIADFPFRLSIGTDSGTTITVALVADNGSFGTPAAGTAEIAQTTGDIHWNTTDLTTFAGQAVRFQQQAFFTFDESDANIGIIDDVLLLNPVPATGQFPLIRIAFGEYLTPIERATEAGFLPNPTAGTVEWALNTGRLKFNSGDVTTNTAKAIYYDGSVLGRTLQATTESLGTVSSPSNITTLPPEDSDVFFRIPGVVQFSETLFVDTFSSFPNFGKRDRVEIRRSDAAVQFSFADQILYGTQTPEVIIPDLTIERGMKLRLFRTPVDPKATDDTLKDASAFYESEGATLANPIIASPTVNLPAIPVDTLPITVNVAQGTGSFPPGTLPRLDVVSPPAGFGYIIDSIERRFNFAQRRNDEVAFYRAPYSNVSFAAPLAFSSNLVVELEDSAGSDTFSPLTLDEDYIINLAAGLVTLTSTDGTLITSGSTGDFSGTTFTDTAQDFTAAGVVQGDLLIVPSGPAVGVYTVDTPGTTSLTTDVAGGTTPNVQYEIRRGSEILVDRFFKEVPAVDPNTAVERVNVLGTTTNATRLTLDLAFKDVTRFRFGKLTFSTSVVQVVDDLAFTAPASLATGVVELSLDTGNLNFSQVDVDAAQLVYWSRTLTLGVDYGLQPPLGLVQFTERMLANEEVFVTYVVLDDDDNRVIVEERGTFIVRKELTADHPDPTSTLFFNPLDREVATVPAPAAFRGGRPQGSDKVTFDLATSGATSVTFLPSDQITDALPSGATVSPIERVLVDYFVHEAIGGEKTLTVVQQAMVGVIINIEAEVPSFTIAGDRTALFPANHLLRVDNEEIYLLGGSTYSAGTELTTVTLASPQEFRSDFRNPVLAVTSGQTRPSSFFLFPSYFVTETATYTTVPRGNARFKLSGDQTRDYISGTVVQFSGTGYTDYSLVTGSLYDSATNRTEVVLTGNGARQYTFGVDTLRRSVRAILEKPTGTAPTLRDPILELPFTVYRRVEGSPGQVLVSPEDYRIDGAGRVTFTDPLVDDEELAVLYTGTVTIDDGRDFRSSFTHQIGPSVTNGLLAQILTLDYTTYAPDSYYWRVETMTNFRGELAEQYNDAAKAGSPTGGPILENASGASLFEQGRESVFFQEGRLANEDITARPTLKFFNDGINFLEDALEVMDGRVVGDQDGRFLFDGLVDNPNRATLAAVTNQIDDKVSVGVQVTSVPFPTPPFVVFEDVFQEMYKPASFSRFYPTKRIVGGVAVDATGLETGDLIMDLGFKNLSKVQSIARRVPWAVVTEAAPIGATVLTVDKTDGSPNLFRPPFEYPTFLTMPIVIQEQDGTYVIDDALANISPFTLTAVTATTITLSAGVPAAVPVGATVRVAFFDLTPPAFPLTPFPKSFRPNFDLGVDLAGGTLTHIEPFPPFDGTIFSNELDIQRAHGFPTAGRALDAVLRINNALTTPYRFAALDGGTLDDNNNHGWPILNPSIDSEAGVNADGLDLGSLSLEKLLVESGGTLRGLTEAPFVGVGSLNVGITRITLDSGTFPSPAPEVGDLVRILSGANAGLDYRSITAATATWIEVSGGAAWVTQEAGVSFTVAVSSDLETGTGAITGLTALFDAAAFYVSGGVQVGHTVVAESGANAGLRRQVTVVSGETTLATTAWPANDAAMVYRIDNSLSTFGGTGSIIDTDLIPALDAQLVLLDTGTPSSRASLEDFFDHVFLDIVSGTAGSTSIGGSSLTDVAATFLSADINLAIDFIYIRSGTVAGVYKLDPNGTLSDTLLPIEDTFPATAAGVTYRVVRPESMGKNGLVDVFTALAAVDQAILDVTAFKALVSALIPVVGDAGAHATALLTTDLDSRTTEITTRSTDLTSPAGSVSLISSVMSSGDRLYDRRFVWIDARTNLETGILTKKDRAVENRLKQQDEILKQLTKLLTTQTT